MLDDISKTYWTKVYVTYGTNFRAWKTSWGNALVNEYINEPISSVPYLYDCGYIDAQHKIFTQKFIDEVINK